MTIHLLIAVSLRKDQSCGVRANSMLKVLVKLIGLRSDGAWLVEKGRAALEGSRERASALL